MKIILVIILSIFLYSPLITTQDENAKPVICVIVGEVWKSSSGYVFNITELPERCDIITVGQFALDRSGVETLVDVEDEKAIKILTEANKNVYLSIGFLFDEDWCSILNALDENEYKTRIFDPLVGFLNKYKISGLFMCIPDMLNGAIENVSQKINDFVTSIKNKVAGLKVGLVFVVWKQVSNKTRK
ncbi:uncharacterized protein LOC132925858 [Rhopalosiphum padi]|uniref:uncharacterized protein LOC132925858 n=1 Tax=Rhopalosiphum padi TaxID=40932 RepID=UPI00298EAC69|nr:uncharacterized protein LOC132925858 [Rhopalosiphum padi]